MYKYKSKIYHHWLIILKGTVYTDTLSHSSFVLFKSIILSYFIPTRIFYSSLVVSFSYYYNIFFRLQCTVEDNFPKLCVHCRIYFTQVFTEWNIFVLKLNLTFQVRTYIYLLGYSCVCLCWDGSNGLKS